MLEVRLIGKFDLVCDGQHVIISSRIAQSLFAYLILNSGTLHRREKLAGMFWPDAKEEKARAYLRHELWRIRKALHPKSKVNYLMVDNMNISFNSSAEHWLDVTVLENLREAASIDEMINALAPYQGELLPGFYEDWIVLEREHLQAVYEQKIARLLELLKREKRWSDVLAWAERWISFGQGPEAAYRYLMIAYDMLGDRAKVASTYERCVHTLRELDLEPSEQTRALAFKRTSKLNIPIPLSSFIGREKEIKEVVDLFSKSRLITLTGSGGVGKTRLAIQVVAEVLDLFPDGVWFLNLAPLNDPGLVPDTLANLIGLRESGELAVTDHLTNYFRTRTALVIIDNCEHVIDSCAQLIFSLLTSCANLSVLATSRETLRVSGEIPYRVPSLEIPKPDIAFTVDELSNIESMKLFIARAAFASLNFAINSQNATTIAQICQRLDGIPLAIELAAARANMLTVEQIAKRLDDRFNLLTHGLRSSLPRHQTLRAMIEWSYDLLVKKARILFRRLSVFAGGWTLEAAEEVCCGNGIKSSNVPDLLTQLVNKSLVLVETEGTETRYRSLETIHHYGLEQLRRSGEEESIRIQHLKYFFQFSEQAESGLRGPSQMEWYTHLEFESDNIRAALVWADETDVETGLHILGNLDRFWDGFALREGSYWLSKFLHKQESRAYPRARAKALQAHAPGLIALQQFETMLSEIEECLALYRSVGDQRGEIDALLLLGCLTHTANNVERNQQALDLARSIGDEWRQARALSILGGNHIGAKRFAYWEKAIKLFRKSGDWRSLKDNLSAQAFSLVLDDDIELAQKYVDEAELLKWSNKSTEAEVLRWSNKGTGVWADLATAKSIIASLHGDYQQANILLQKILIQAEETGNRMNYLWARVRLGYVAVREGKLNEAQIVFAEIVPEFVKDAYPIGVAFSLEGIAQLYVAVNKLEHAARLVGWADAMREKIPDRRLPLEQADVDKIIAAGIAHLGELAFSNAYQEGQTMTLDEVVAYALKEMDQPLSYGQLLPL